MTTTNHRYRAFGLEIESQLSLPELPTVAGPVLAPDLEIHFGFAPKPENSGAMDRCVSVKPDEVHLFWEEAGSFVIRAGNEIVIDPVAGAEESLLRTGVLGPGLATILQQRGHLVLHASAVVVQGRAIGFIGWKGQGKSTTAAALFARGCQFLTDDLLTLSANDHGCVLAHPSFPQFKLWPDSARSSLAEDGESLPRLMNGYEKRIRTVKDGYVKEPVPLAAVYVLTTGPERKAKRLSPQETFKQIVSNTFCARYGGRVFEGRTRSTHLANVAKVTSHVPVFKLERPRSLDQLGELANFVTEHATHL